MQKLLPGKAYSTKWGEYEAVVDLREAHPQARFDSPDGVVFMGTEPPCSVETAIAWVVAKLKVRGCKAFVDGRERDLAAFLVFTETMPS